MKMKMMMGGGKVGLSSVETQPLALYFTYLAVFRFCLLPIVLTAAVSGTPRIHRKKRFQIEDEDEDD